METICKAKLVLALCVAMTTIVTAKSPHILFLLADDLGWNDVGFHNPLIQTPNIDALAGKGVVLNQSYVQPGCTPSRHAFLTGRYPFRDGMQRSVIMDTEPKCLPLDLPLLPEKLKQGGYATHLVGKWHLGLCNEACLPHRRGFDSFYGFLGGECDQLTHTRRGLYDFRQNGEVVEDVEGKYSTHLFTQRALDIVQSHDTTQPLFLFMSYDIAHFPLQLPQDYEAKYDQVADAERRTYLNMVSIMDDSIGEVLKALEVAGLYEDSLIVFMSDNGAQHTFAGSNYPLRGSKFTLWEGGVRSPTVVAGSMLQKTGYTHDGLFHMTDWYKTLLAAAEVDSEQCEASRMDSINQWDMLTRGGDSQRREFIYNLDTTAVLKSPPFTGYLAYRYGDYKLIQGFPGFGDVDMTNPWLMPAEACDGSDTPECSFMGKAIAGKDLQAVQSAYSAREQRNLKVDPKDRDTLWLFNIRNDPREMCDLSAEMPELVELLKDKLAGYRAEEAVPMMCQPAELETRDRHGSHGPGWCSTQQLHTMRKRSVEGAKNSETLLDSCDNL